MLPDYVVVDPKLDYLSHGETVRMQEARLIAQAHHCYDYTGFWRKKFDDDGIKPDDIRSLNDLKRIPFCTKEELQKNQIENPPYGSYLGVHPSMLTEYAMTSGTTGRPMVRVLSKRDWRYNVQIALRDPYLHPGDVAVFIGPTDSLFGPRSLSDRVTAMGALAVKASRLSSEDKVRLIDSLKPRIVFGTPSFLLYLSELAKQMGAGIHGSVELISAFGEPGASIPATKRRLIDEWGAKQIIDAYGMTEVVGMGSICSGSGQIHCPNDFVITEIIDPDTGENLGPNQRGELVFTNIFGDSQPLLRYKTRDIARLAEFGPCPACGKTSTRIVQGIEGRIDNMIWYKGINIFPSAVESVVRSFHELSNEFEILLEKKGERQTITIKVEVKDAIEIQNHGRIKDQLSERLLDALEGVNATIEILKEGTLPKTTHKAQRVRDLRGDPGE